MRQTPKLFKVQERTPGPLFPCHVWWARISPAAGVAKNVEFLFVRLSDGHACERQSLCARFHHEGVGLQKRF